MKKITLTFAIILLTITLIAQAPQAFKYQAVARDIAGNVLINQNVSFRISILHGSAYGTPVCIETYDTTTNEFGLVNLEIGTGEPENGSFSSIDWGNGPYFIQISVDETGGNNYQLMGTSQLLSVPYALYAGGGVTELDDLTDAITDSLSIFLGTGAGANDELSSNYNVGLGFEALNANTTGIRNTATGFKSLYSNSTGINNTAIGYNSLYSNLTGYFNTAVGVRASFYNSTGNNNTTYGQGADYMNTEGSNNTIIGYEAGKGSILNNKSGNVFLGYKAGYFEYGNNKLYIENSDTLSPLIYGEFDNDIVNINGKVGIGTNTPLYNLDIKSSSADFTSKIRLTSFDYTKDLRLSSGNDIYNPHISFTGADALRFMLYDGGYNELMRITSDGKVCIGTGSFDPLGNLDVRGNGTDDGAVLSLGNSDNSHRLSFFSGCENDPYPFIRWKEGDPLRFSTDEEGWSEKMRITSDGKVGIGTATPVTSLDIRSSSAETHSTISLRNSDYTNTLYIGSGHETENPYFSFMGGSALRFIAYDGVDNELMRLTNEGRLAIGTTTPFGNLDVHGNDSARIYISPAGIANSLSTAIMFRSTFGGTVPDLGPRNNVLIKAHFDGGGWETAALAFHVSGTDCMTDGDIDPCERMRITSEGKIGIGTTTPINKLDIAGGISIGTTYSGSEIAPSDGAIIEGNVGIGTSAPVSKLDIKGNVTIRDLTTGNVVIELGNGLDYAEGFYVTNNSMIEPGTILCIDPDNPGSLKLSESPYDKTVAGIVAGANGLGSGVRLGTEEFDCDVALAGRVYCNVITTTENIEPGDLLTTSSIPGFAMKVTDFNKSQGAILGKAMESLEKGTKGQILVLVTLQ